MEVKGIVQERNINSIKVDNLWIKFFETGVLTNVKVNDLVEVIYKDNKKDNKVYHNGTEIKVLTSEKVIPNLSEKTLNTLIMCTTQLKCNSEEHREQDLHQIFCELQELL